MNNAQETQSTLSGRDKPMPRLSVVTFQLGVRSEVWLWRQLRLFKRVKPSVITWGYQNQEDYPLDDIEIDILDTEPVCERGRSRWLWRLRNAPSGNFFAARGGDLSAIKATIRKQKPDVMLCHFGWDALRVLPSVEAMELPLVAHFHGRDLSSSLRNRWYRSSLVRHVRKFAACIVVGTRQKDVLTEIGVCAENIYVIPCGVPIGEFIPLDGNRDKGFQGVCVSRLSKEKGVRETLLAFAEARRRLGYGRLVIVGDGRERGGLEALSKELGVSESVAFRGELPSPGVLQELQASNAFLQHSLTGKTGWIEGFGVSCAEAASTALPVVGTRSGGILDQVIHGRTGLLVSEHDTDAMAEAIVTLAKDPTLRRRMGRAGRERMKSHFDTKNQVRKLENALLEVANG